MIYKTSYSLLDLFYKDVLSEVFDFGGKVNRLLYFEIPLFYVLLRVESQDVIRLAHRTKDFKHLGEQKNIKRLCGFFYHLAAGHVIQEKEKLLKAYEIYE